MHYIRAKKPTMDKIKKLMFGTQENRNSLLQNLQRTGEDHLDLKEQGFVPQDGPDSDLGRAHKNWSQAMREYLDELTELMTELAEPVDYPQED